MSADPVVSLDLLRARRALARLRRAALFVREPYVPDPRTAWERLVAAAWRATGGEAEDKALCRCALEYARTTARPSEDELSLAAFAYARAVAVPFMEVRHG